ncbi:MAG: hypothetical protein QM791_18870 [Ferruginibacter sp.]
MNAKESPGSIAYKFLSICLLLGFIYYWLFTFGLVFSYRTVRKIAPAQTVVYSSLFNQNWRLFSFTKPYNSEADFIVRKITDPSKTDTIHLLGYSIEQRRKYAPFNYFPEALNRIIGRTLDHADNLLQTKKRLLQKQQPGQAEAIYLQAVSLQAETDSLLIPDLKNLKSYGKYILEKKQADTNGLEFQLRIVHKYIDPVKTFNIADSSKNRVVFISTFKSL